LIGPREFRIVLLLSLVAALHVFVFAAAFPFFSPVDEPAQFDLVLRYSRGDIPRGAAPLDPESLRYIRYYGTLEYLWNENGLAQHSFPPPPWKLRSIAATDDFAAAKQKDLAGISP
jgi:hypothetical protein